MPSKADDYRDRQLDRRQSVLQSTSHPQPWWQGVGGNNLSFGQSASKSSSVENLNGSFANGVMQSQNSSALDNGANLNKDIQVAVSSQSDGSNRQDRCLEQISSMPVAVDGHLDPNSQMELVGHSIVLTPYPHSDPQYGGMLTSYGPRAMVPPQLYGMHHSRMPLPLEMEEEPVYVNAKQFHGILRRRQARAKAELEKKAIKVRKPYLHESRHQHAMRRARGCGGRFLSAKKDDNNAAHRTSDESIISGTNLSNQSASVLGAQWLPANGNRGLYSVDPQQGKKDMQEHDSTDGNRSGQRLSSMYHSSDAIVGGCMGKQRETAHRNGDSNGALPIN